MRSPRSACSRRPLGTRDGLYDFYSRHASEPLVIDKWFALQAIIPAADTLDRVIRLLKAIRPFRSATRTGFARLSAHSRAAIRPVSMRKMAAAMISSPALCLISITEEPTGRGAVARRVQKLAFARAKSTPSSSRGGAAPRRRPRQDFPPMSGTSSIDRSVEPRRQRAIG